MSDLLDDLLQDLPSKGGGVHRSKPWSSEHTLEEPSNFHRLAKQPDALVLAIIRTRCTCCGSVHEYPSQWLLYRFDKNYSWTTASLDSDPGLPHEVRIMEIENAYCERCFTGATEPPTVHRRDVDGQPPPLGESGESHAPRAA